MKVIQCDVCGGTLPSDHDTENRKEEFVLNGTHFAVEIQPEMYIPSGYTDDDEDSDEEERRVRYPDLCYNCIIPLVEAVLAKMKKEAPKVDSITGRPIEKKKPRKK